MNKSIKLGIVLCVLIAMTTFVGAVIINGKSTYGNVTIVYADDFTSNGDLIGNWYWLRDSGYKHYGQWNFSGLPNSTSDGFVYIYLKCLVTNTINGGSGYSTDIKLFDPSNPSKFATVHLYNLHPEFQEPSYTYGWGYESRGWLKICDCRIPPSGNLTLRLERFPPNTEHVAVNKNSVTIEYR